MTSRRRTLVVVAIVVLLLAAAGGGAWWGISNYQATHGPECSVPRPTAAQADASGVTPAAGTAATGPLGLDAVQLQHASTINAVGIERGESARARVIAVATAWQESSLRNLDHGDRDSLGLFQQRPSQGWGEAAQIMDPVYAAGQFYDHLAKVAGWEAMPLADAAQAVQRSGFPDAYARWEWDAATLVDGLSGGGPVTLSCRRGAVGSSAPAPQRPAVTGASGASAPLAQLLSAAQAELGPLTVTVAGVDSATVSVAPPDLPAEVAGRALAAWAVAHAASFGVATVTVGDQAWTDNAWGDAQAPTGAGEVTLAVTAPR